MAPSPEQLDPERCRRRQELLAALAHAKSGRDTDTSLRLRGLRLRELIAIRRRPAS